MKLKPSKGNESDAVSRREDCCTERLGYSLGKFMNITEFETRSCLGKKSERYIFDKWMEIRA